MQALCSVTNAYYLELRASELITEAQLSVREKPFTPHYNQCIIRAIRLLALAQGMRAAQCDHGIPQSDDGGRIVETTS